ncbi:MAG: bifunctional UDP-N-acetylglucosamine diphosphorylase/glucosamine-1-phosphate N-acetyltransferase GlmU [Microbacteriaceae bacterium]|nr:bifunctional UDP-N-acetylglucosamine diphosphorylase/glucosamine-1-phosphate N-acetyltransferase GlmU [Microbacteriaceae bacterium]
MHTESVAVVILAAGQGTRMKSALPKVLHQIAGRSLIEHVLTTAYSITPSYVVAVVRHEREMVGSAITAFQPDTILVDQDEIPGTGRAVEQAIEALPADFDGSVVVLSGDAPLIDTTTLQELIIGHTQNGRDMTILSAIFPDPTGLGRILRDSAGEVVGIVEEKDATEAQRQVQEINGGVYVFGREALAAALAQIGTDNAQGEKYLTDAAAVLLRDGGKVGAVAAGDPWVIAGVNDRAQLADAGRELNARICRALQKSGVSIPDPASTYIDITAKIAPDSTVMPGSFVLGNSVLESGSVVGPASTVRDTIVGSNAAILRSEVHSAKIAAGSVIGPFAYVRPGTEVAEGGKIGAFVEVKNSTIGAGSKVPHLSYVGDTTVGDDSNIGAGTIVANYDGVKKHRSTVGHGVRIGSKNVLVSPVTIADGAYTAAGAVIRKDVAAGDLALNVTSQRNLAGWVVANRPGTSSAAAATNSSSQTSETAPDMPGTESEANDTSKTTSQTSVNN